MANNLDAPDVEEEVPPPSEKVNFKATLQMLWHDGHFNDEEYLTVMRQAGFIEPCAMQPRQVPSKVVGGTSRSMSNCTTWMGNFTSMDEYVRAREGGRIPHGSNVFGHWISHAGGNGQA